MINYKRTTAITLTIIFILFVASSTALAVSSSSPSTGATSNNGLKVEGDASGTKLKGVVAVSITDLHCDFAHTIAGGATADEFWGECTEEEGGGINAANSTVIVRLSDGNANSEAGVHAFYIDLEAVPFPKDQDVQTIITEALRPYILEKFFEVPFGVESPLAIHLKEISQYKEANIRSKDYDEPFDEEEPYTPSMTVASIILAIN